MTAPGIPNFPPVPVQEAHIDYDLDQPLYTVNGQLGTGQAGDICHHFRLEYQSNGAVEIRSQNHLDRAQMGVVALGEHTHRDQKNAVVVKTLYRDLFYRREDGLFRTMDEYGQYRPTLEDPEMEAKIMHGFGYLDEILGCVNFVRRMNGPEEERHHYLIMPYAQGGDLLAYVNRFKGLAEQEAKRIFCHILHGVATLHSYGICHRDLSLENTLLTGHPEPIPMISDCAVADAFPLVPGFPPNNRRVGKPNCMAPEVRRCAYYPHATYDGHLADMFSLGNMLYMMVTCRKPGNREEMQGCLSARGYPSESHLAKLIFRLISRNPTERPTTLPDHTNECIFGDPWFTGHNLPVETYNNRRSVMSHLQEAYVAQINQ